MTDGFADYLPQVRCSEDLKGKLMTVVVREPGSIADHIRHAVELYVEGTCLAPETMSEVRSLGKEMVIGSRGVVLNEDAVVRALCRHWRQTAQKN